MVISSGTVLRIEIFLKTDEHDRHGRGVLGKRRAERLQGLARQLQVALLAAGSVQGDEVEHGHVVGAWQSAVVGVFGPGQQGLVIARGEEEAAFLGITEIGDHAVGQGARLVHPPGVSRRGVQSQQAVDQVGIILEVGRQLGLAGPIGPQQASARVAEMRPRGNRQPSPPPGDSFRS